MKMRPRLGATGFLLLLSPCPVSSWRIEKGGTIAHQNQPTSQQQQEQRRTPPNAADPDYIHPTARGGRAQAPGHDGAVVLVSKVHAATHPTPFETVTVPPLELRAQYTVEENAVQRYIVPGDGRRSPYEQEVRVKIWGAGGGGCDGGRGETTDPAPNTDEEDETVKFSEGSAGGYVDATFILPVGSELHIVVGGGGGRTLLSSAQGPPPTGSLGGLGGYNGGHPGRPDAVSGGGGGGGLTTVKMRNGTILAAAHGGDGGGSTAYCTAAGGAGASLRGEPGDDGGYINFAFASLRGGVRDGDETMASCPEVPTVRHLSHNSAEFTWNAGSHQTKQSKELYVQKYIVQLSEGNNSADGDTPECSEDYKLHQHIPRDADSQRNASTLVDSLEASSPYCIRIEAFSVEGLSLGVQVLPFITAAAPVNRWVPVTAGGRATISEKAIVALDSSTASWCEHSTGRPTGRRGHSMTIVNDQVYIFGGATLKCVCEKQFPKNDTATHLEEAAKPQCSSKNVYSDELWHYDPKTELFSQLAGEAGQPWPRGREQHSATALPDGNIIFIGGESTTNSDLEIGSASEKLLLGDVWRMKNPYHVLSRVFRGSTDGLQIGVVPVQELIPGHVASHQLTIGEENNERCISDIQVRVFLQHKCPKGIEYITLTKEAKDLNNRDYEVKMFVGSMGSREHECRSSSLDLLFSDDATEPIQSYASIPTSGSFRPASNLLSTFGDLPIHGKWTISIAQSQPMDQEEEDYYGELLDWELTLVSKPCVARVKWEKLLLSSPSPFSPRRLHSAVAVDHSIFVAGGFSERRYLDDLWRFSCDSNSCLWTELNNASPNTSLLQGAKRTWPLNGQAAFFSQYGLLVYGGLAKYGPLQQGKDLWLLDLFQDHWLSVPIEENDRIGDKDRFNYSVPYGRYLSSIGFLNHSMAIVFGGDSGLLHNSYSDDYGFVPNSFYDDVWLLSPAGTPFTRPREKANCLGLGLDWNSTCGVEGVPGDPCRFLDILAAAWCKEQYQSVR